MELINPVSSSTTESIICGDAVELLRYCPEKPRLILTDPPYGKNYRSHMAGDRRWNKTGVPVQERNGKTAVFDVLPNDDSPDAIDFPTFFGAAYDALPSDGFLICFSDDRCLARWIPMAANAGFDHKGTAIWNKKCANGGDLRWPFIHVTEFILFLSKGNPPTYPVIGPDGGFQQQIPNIFNYGRVPKSEYAGHPTQKPLLLCEQLIRATTQTGELVIDPFCGSGSTLAAAKRLKRRYLGCDISGEYAQIARNRLEQTVEGCSLAAN